ncbi:MAG: two-component system sensor histidine kinase NtrB [Candidatus Bathyarchaeia archaeon]
MSKQNRIARNVGFIIFISIVVVILLLIATGYTQQGAFNPPYLRLALNAIFISATNIFVAIVAVRSFLRYGQISFALLSGALVASGLAAFLSGWVTGISTNATFTIFNIGFLISSIMQVFGAVYLSAASPVSKVLSNRGLIIGLILLLSIGSVSLVTALAVAGLTPPFVTVEGGTTDLRQFVVILSFLFFVFASVVFGYQYLRTRTRVLYWYSLALALFALDLFISYNSTELGDALQWVGRISDYLGGVFFIIALLSLRQQVFAGTDFSERWFETFGNSRRQFASLFANMLSGFAYMRVIADKYGRAVDAVFLEVNDAFETNTGLKKADILGKRLTQVISGIESDPGDWLSILGRIALKREPARIENYMASLHRWFRVSGYSPEKGYVVVLFEDITMHKELQRQLERYTKDLERIVDERTKQLRESERLAAIGQTAGMVGHDIRNPLQAITSDLYLIEQEIKVNPTCISPEIAESIAAIEENIAYINKIVSDLQDYTRTLKPTMSQVSVKDIVNSALSGRKIPSNITIRKPENGLVIVTDPTFLRRIITNLVTNAIQAMPKGGKLDIEAIKEDKTACISLSDTGVGISEDAKANMFKPLFTTKAKGQGLGLAVVKRLVELLDGEITFESRVGAGTTFIVRLPLEKQAGHPHALC